MDPMLGRVFSEWKSSEAGVEQTRGRPRQGPNAGRLMAMKLLIRNLARTTTESDLRDLFEAFGQVQSCSIVLDAETGRSKGFGFVEMPKAGEAKAAVSNLNDVHLDGERIRVKNAKPKPAKP